MSKQLPSQPNLRHLKNEAKEFHKALDRGDAGMAERLAANLPRLSGATPAQIAAADVSLQEVQHVMANEYGFASWAELAASVESSFESLAQLSDQDLEILRDTLQSSLAFQRSISQSDIVAALQHADSGRGSIRQRLLLALSDRLRWSILQELESAAATEAEGREAQAKIVDLVRQLGKDGRIAWPPGSQTASSPAPPPSLPKGLEAVDRSLEQLSIDQVRQICHGLSRMVKSYGESVYSIGPGDFYREIEAVGWRSSANIGEALGLAADGTEPGKIRHLMKNRRDNVIQRLEVRLQVILEGVTAIRGDEPPPLILRRLDTICYSGYETQYRGPEGTVEQFRDRAAQKPISHHRNDELAMAIVDLAWIAKQRDAAALREVVDIIDDTHLRDGIQMVIDQMDPAELTAELERRIEPTLKQFWGPFTAFGEGLVAALEGKTDADLDHILDAALAGD